MRRFGRNCRHSHLLYEHLFKMKEGQTIALVSLNEIRIIRLEKIKENKIEGMGIVNTFYDELLGEE